MMTMVIQQLASFLCARLIVIEDLQQIFLRSLLQQHMDSADADSDKKDEEEDNCVADNALMT